MSALLEEALGALREEGALDEGRKRALRLRLLATATRRSRVQVARWSIPVAAVLVVASAWAAVGRHRAPIEPRPPAPRAPVALLTGPAALPSPAVSATEVAAAAGAPAATPAPAASSPPHSTRAAKVVQSAVHPRPAQRGAASAPPPAGDDAALRALRVFREADHLQFEDHDYAGALDAWDRYLAQAGTNPLTVDARYERARCLVRLGRVEEARAALSPFADAPAGAYRREEARALLDRIR